MKKTTFVLTILLAGLTAAAATDTVSVIVSGHPIEPIPSYKVGGHTYLEAKRVGAIYGGQVYWYPVSGRVQLTLRGRTVQFVTESNKATAGEENFVLDAPVIVRVSKAFLPIAFLASPEFERWSGFDAHFDSGTRTLQVERRTTVGPIHTFSYKDRTRVTVELGASVKPQVSAQGLGALDVIIPNGVIDDNDHVTIDDGIISSFILKQEIRQARITIRLGAQGLKWKSEENNDPHRLVLDVFATGVNPEDAAVIPVNTISTATVSVSTPAVIVTTPAVTTSIRKKRIIVLDAGHGGKDPGAKGGRGTKEKDINLSATLELASVLRARGDFDVYLTREDDSFIPLSDRSKKANDLNADLFISMHCNSATNRRERGFEVYSVSETASDPEAERLAEAENAALVLEGKKPEDEMASQILLAMTKTEMLNESAPFAALVERSVSKRVDVSSRGQKQAAFYVLRGTHAPAILVEMAFISHPKEEAMLSAKQFRRKMAEGVAAGVADYARKKGWLQ